MKVLGAQNDQICDFYWNSILSVLPNRNQTRKTRVIISIYFGNDIPFLDPSSTNKSCSDIHILNEEMIANHSDKLTDSFKKQILLTPGKLIGY